MSSLYKKKILLICNPRSGKNGARAHAYAIAALFPQDRYAVTVKKTVCRGDAAETAYIYANKYDIIAAAGGDGTLSEVISGVARSGADVPIGYIPMGSTNDFASTSGIPFDVREAVGIIISGHTNTYDTAVFNNRPFSYIACFGPGARVSYSTTQRMKNTFGYGAYMVNGVFFNAISTLMEARPKHIAVEYDGSSIEGDFIFGAVSNALAVAGMFRFDENKICLNDGKFELLLVKKADSPSDIFGMVNNVRRGEMNGDSLIFLSASDIRMTFENAAGWTVDGEYGGSERSVHINVNKQSVRIFSPKSTLFVK